MEETVMKNQNLPWSGKEFVVTGRLESFTRPQAEAKIRELGGTAKDNVTRKTNHVVVGVDPGSKKDRAEALGIEIWNEARFLEEIGKANK